MSTRLPNLFLPGAQKSGTTTLVGLLSTHRAIHVGARKEPHFFSIDHRFRRGASYYRQLCRGWREERYVFDGSQSYLPLPFVPERMAQLLGTDLKFIVVLRHPVDRARSAFAHMRLLPGGELTRSIAEIVPVNLDQMSLDELLPWEAAEIRRRLAQGDLKGRHDTWTTHLFPFNYFQVSAYARQIESFLHCFSRDNFLFLTFEEVTDDQEVVKQKCAAFLDLDPAGFGSGPSRRRHETVQYRLPVLKPLHYLRGPLRRIVPDPIACRLRNWERRYFVQDSNIRFDEPTRQVLCRLYAGEIDRVAQLTGLNLDSWKKSRRHSPPAVATDATAAE